jgi:hypothetical protein
MIKFKNQNTSFDAQNTQPNGLTRDPGDSRLRLACISKVIRIKHVKYLILIFNSKEKILIKTITLNKAKKKKKKLLVTRFVF